MMTLQLSALLWGMKQIRKHFDGLNPGVPQEQTPEETDDTCSECDQDPCVCCLDWHHDRRDPAYDPRHKWLLIGESEDGREFYRCGKCGKERDQ